MFKTIKKPFIKTKDHYKNLIQETKTDYEKTKAYYETGKDEDNFHKQKEEAQRKEIFVKGILALIITGILFLFWVITKFL